MDDGVIFVSKKKPQILASLAATIGAFALGTVLGWSSPAFPSLDATRPFDLTDDQKTWIASLALLGAAVACPIAGIFIELLGRKFTILIVSLPFCIGWLLIALLNDVQFIYAGRFLTGFCGGALSLAIPIYIGEITERGEIGARLASGVQLAIAGGILFSYVFGAFIEWSWLSILCALFPLTLGVLMVSMPETPRHLLNKGKLCDASLELSWLRGAGFSLNVDAELQETKRIIEETRKSGGRCRDFFTWISIKSLMICLVLMILQQFSGIYAVLFYAVYIFRSAEIDQDVNNAAMALAITNIIATILSTQALEQSGRKRLIIISALIMAISSGVLGGYFYAPVEWKNYFDLHRYISLIPIVCMISYIAAFAIGLGPVPAIIIREMFPLGTIGFAYSIVSTVSWGLAFLMTLYYDQYKTEMGNAWVFWSFSIICVVGASFILCIVPETKGKTPEEIRKGIGKRGTNTSAKLAESLKTNIPSMPVKPAIWRKGKKPEEGKDEEGQDQEPKDPDLEAKEKGEKGKEKKPSKLPWSGKWRKGKKKDEEAPKEPETETKARKKDENDQEAKSEEMKKSESEGTSKEGKEPEIKLEEAKAKPQDEKVQEIKTEGEKNKDDSAVLQL